MEHNIGGKLAQNMNTGSSGFILQVRLQAGCIERETVLCVKEGDKHLSPGQNLRMHRVGTSCSYCKKLSINIVPRFHHIEGSKLPLG